MLLNKVINAYQLGGIKFLAAWIFDSLTSSTNQRSAVLYNIQKTLPESKYKDFLKKWYKFNMNLELDIDDPTTADEKINWLKLNDSTPIKTKLADKYLAREYVQEKVGEKYLTKLYGVYENFDEIDFDSLPNRFVIKCNHGSGWNIKIKDKTQFNVKEAKKKINKWLKTNYAFASGLELHYKDIVPKIIIEEYIGNAEEDIYEYKFHFCNGKLKLLSVYKNLDMESSEGGGTQNIVSPDFVEIQTDDTVLPRDPNPPKKPENYDELLDVAEKLKGDFMYVRVDLYNCNGRVYFGELTFTSSSGVDSWVKVDNKELESFSIFNCK